MPLEHINITVENAPEFAGRLCQYFNWKIRWEGQGKLGGKTIHVGDESSYLALWTPVSFDDAPNYNVVNHIGIVMDDLDKTEARIKALGIKTHSHANYEPGRRFYFDDPTGLEIEVISYA